MQEETKKDKSISREEISKDGLKKGSKYISFTIPIYDDENENSVLDHTQFEAKEKDVGIMISLLGDLVLFKNNPEKISRILNKIEDIAYETDLIENEN